MKKLLLFLFGALIICACEPKEEECFRNDDLSGVELKKKGKKHPVPFRGEFETQVLSAGPCDEGFCVSVIGSGKATHLGKTDMVDEEVNDGEIRRAYVTFTAANGDKLQVDFMRPSAPPQPGPVIYFSSPGTVIGDESTGRFEGASGNMESNGSVNVVEGVGQVVFTGEIMY